MRQPATVREVGGVPLWFGEHVGRAEPAALKTDFRVLVLGDSVLQPAGLQQHEGAAAKLGPELARRDGRRRFEVVNAAEGGWGTIQEEAWFFESGIDLAPDLVLIGIADNDTQEFVHHRGQIMHVTLVDALGARRSDGLMGTLARRSYLYNLLWLSLARVAIDQRLESESDAEERLVVEPLRRIHAATLAHGARLALVCFSQRPPPNAQAGPYACGLQKAAAWAHAEGIPLLDAQPLFDGNPVEEVWMDHVHLTAFGHDILTRGLADWLIESGALAQRSSVIDPERVGGRELPVEPTSVTRLA